MKSGEVTGINISAPCQPKTGILLLLLLTHQLTLNRRGHDLNIKNMLHTIIKPFIELLWFIQIQCNVLVGVIHHEYTIHHDSDVTGEGLS